MMTAAATERQMINEKKKKKRKCFQFFQITENKTQIKIRCQTEHHSVLYRNKLNTAEFCTADKDKTSSVGTAGGIRLINKIYNVLIEN